MFMFVLSFFKRHKVFNWTQDALEDSAQNIKSGISQIRVDEETAEYLWAEEKLIINYM